MLRQCRFLVQQRETKVAIQPNTKPILITAVELATIYFGGERRRIYRAQARDINPLPKSREIAGRACFLVSEIDDWFAEEIARNERGDRRVWPAGQRKTDSSLNSGGKPE